MSARLAPAERRASDAAATQGLFGPSGESHSLFGEILDWMLAPLLLLWPMSVALTWLVAQNIAHKPFDRELGEMVRVLAKQVVLADANGGPAQAQFTLPPGSTQYTLTGLTPGVTYERRYSLPDGTVLTASTMTLAGTAGQLQAPVNALEVLECARQCVVTHSEFRAYGNGRERVEHVVGARKIHCQPQRCRVARP